MFIQIQYYRTFVFFSSPVDQLFDRWLVDAVAAVSCFLWQDLPADQRVSGRRFTLQLVCQESSFGLFDVSASDRQAAEHKYSICAEQSSSRRHFHWLFWCCFQTVKFGWCVWCFSRFISVLSHSSAAPPAGHWNAYSCFHSLIQSVYIQRENIDSV